MTRSPPSDSHLGPRFLGLAALAFAGIAGAAPGATSPGTEGATDTGAITPTATAAPTGAMLPLEAEFRAAYPVGPLVPVTTLAGVDLSALTVPGLHVTAKSIDESNTGFVTSLSDSAGVVRVLLHLSVAPDAKAARAIVDAELHGVSTQLLPAPPALGAPAWADAGGKGDYLVVAAQGNIAYSVHVLSAMPGLPTAATLAANVRAHMIPGTPMAPAVTLRMAPSVDAKKGDAFTVSVAGGLPYEIRADGGYIAHGPKVRPFGPGKVTVYATTIDALGRVGVGEASTLAVP